MSDTSVTGMLHGVKLSELRIIPGEHGDVLHAMKATDESFTSFGEAYFSMVYRGKRKGWKKHTRMTLNIVVPVGEIGFVMYDDRKESQTFGMVREVTLSRKNYLRLTVPPGIWMAFYGKSDGENILMNIASIPHDPLESENLPIDTPHIKYNWQ